MFSNGPFGLDEGALRNVKDTLHHNGWREAFTFMFLFWCGGAIVFSIVDYAPVPSKAVFFGVFLAGLVFSWCFHWFFFGRVTNELKRRKLQRERDIRESKKAEQDKQIAAAKASGKFDKWNG